MLESAKTEGQRCHGGVCLQRLFYFIVWFFTSGCHPVYSSWRSGGEREKTERSHPRTSLLCGRLLPVFALKEKKTFKMMLMFFIVQM